MYNLKDKIMLRNFLRTSTRFMCVFFLLFSFSMQAQQTFFQLESNTKTRIEGKRLIIPNKFKLSSLAHSNLKNYLTNAPHEDNIEAKNSTYILELPTPDGEMMAFSIVESPIFEPGLAEKYPNIKTYLGQGVKDKSASVRLDISPVGFHAMILSHKGAIFIDPYSQHNTEYIISYYAKDFEKQDGLNSFDCGVADVYNELDFPIPSAPENINQETASIPESIPSPSGSELRKFRMALAADGEYTIFHGGTVPLAMAAMTTSINRVNEVLENEVAVRLVLISNTDTLIETDSILDPYTNGNTNIMIDEAQTEITSVIGSANFDVGHLYGKDIGGLAFVGVVCNDNFKAGGVSGHFNPVGDPFDVSVVCHELGHMFGAHHAQNNTCNRSATSSFEVASGSTIMSYAGVCSPDLQNNSDPQYNTYSYQQIQDFLDGITCADIIPTTNTPPTADAGIGGYTIPASTPFELTGSGTDVDGDTLTYLWEQRDLGPETVTIADVNNPTGNAPIFRIWTPSTNPTRTFPRLIDLLNNTTSFGETLPTYSRSLNFMFAVRDNNAGTGGLDYDSLSLEVSTVGGPFLVQSPNGGESIAENESTTITWDVANTNIAPINCSHVSIYLSTDGGFTYPITLANNVPNSGTQQVTIPLGIVPNGQSSLGTCRVKVKAENNVFFDISDFNFIITEPTNPDFVLNPSDNPITICSPTISIDSLEVESILTFDDTVQLSVTGVPPGASFTFGNSLVPAGTSTSITFDPGTVTNGDYTITVTGVHDTIEHSVEINYLVSDDVPSTTTLTSPLDNEDEVPVGVNFTWNTLDFTQDYTIEIATDSNFNTIVQTGTVTDTNYFPSPTLDLDTEYFWRVLSSNACGQSLWSDTLSFTTTGIPEIYGCTDSTAFNYDPDATSDDGSCEAVVMGCTNEDAINYNAAANVDDGTCLVLGCTDSTATNYNPDANIDNGSCVIYGCTDPLAFNYNPNATIDDGSCDSVDVGCTDPTALNYDSTANTDNGYCIDAIEGCTDTTAFNYNPNANVYDASCIYLPYGCTDSAYFNYDPNAGIDDGSCSNFPVILNFDQVQDSTYTFWITSAATTNVYSVHWEFNNIISPETTDSIDHIFSSNGTYHIEALATWDSNSLPYYLDTVLDITIWGCTDVYATNFDFNASVDDGSCIAAIYGCTDSLANNYNVQANASDNSCIYIIPGCTDSTAINYNPSATIDNGSCIPVILGCTDSTAMNYNPNANTDDGSCISDIMGCTDSTAFNYNPQATIDDGSCIETILGCTDSTALNYNPLANTDDGSCNYSPSNDSIWSVNPTSENHTILIPTSATIDINGTPLVNGDYVGVFFDQSGVLKCGGFIIWNGTNATISAYGAEDGEDNGFQEGENFSWKVWDISTLSTLNAAVTYDTNMPDLGEYTLDGISAIAGLEASSGQSIDMSTGWNFVSTYINPDDADISVSMAPIADDIFLAKDEDGAVYWPNFNINNIGDLTIGKAYKVKMDEEATWNVVGDIVNPSNHDLALEEGWSYLGYLRTENALISSALADITANIWLVKDGEGNVYWPQFNINNIGNMEAGQGYQINMNNADTLTYASNTVTLPSVKLTGNEKPVFYKNAHRTGSNMTLAIPFELINEIANEGDEIAAFNTNGQLIGSTVYTSSNIALTIWGDDASTETIENIQSGEIYTLKLWSSSKSIEYVLEFKLEEDESYHNDRIAVLTDLRISNLEENWTYSLFPNPANSTITIEIFTKDPTAYSLAIFNQLGVKVMQLNESDLEEGQNTVTLDVTSLTNGLYYLILEDGTGKSVKERITIVH